MWIHEYRVIFVFITNGKVVFKLCVFIYLANELFLTNISKYAVEKTFILYKLLFQTKFEI